MNEFKPKQRGNHDDLRYISKDLKNANYIFVRIDSVTKIGTTTIFWATKDLNRAEIYFRFLVDGKDENISKDKV